MVVFFLKWVESLMAGLLRLEQKINEAAYRSCVPRKYSSFVRLRANISCWKRKTGNCLATWVPFPRACLRACFPLIIDTRKYKSLKWWEGGILWLHTLWEALKFNEVSFMLESGWRSRAINPDAFKFIDILAGGLEKIYPSGIFHVCSLFFFISRSTF